MAMKVLGCCPASCCAVCQLVVPTKGVVTNSKWGGPQRRLLGSPRARSLTIRRSVETSKQLSLTTAYVRLQMFASLPMRTLWCISVWCLTLGQHVPRRVRLDQPAVTHESETPCQSVQQLTRCFQMRSCCGKWLYGRSNASPSHVVITPTTRYSGLFI